MAAYVIADVDVHDAALFEKYRPLAAAAIAKHGGRYLVRGGKTETLEGGWEPKRIVVLEFPTMEQAREWYRSEDYAEALMLRTKSCSSRVIFVEGGGP